MKIPGPQKRSYVANRPRAGLAADAHFRGRGIKILLDRVQDSVSLIQE